MTRRVVRVTDDFYEDLDRVFGPERGPNGEPSAMDVLRFEVLPLIEYISENYESLPEAFPGDKEFRVLVTVGRLVPRIAITGALGEDGGFDLIQLDVDLGIDN